MFNNKTLIISFACAVCVALVGWLAFSWFEARSEVEVLCSNFHVGTKEQEVLRTLETGEYMRYQITRLDAGKRIDVNSPYDLGNRNCVILLSQDDQVTNAYVE